jgi:hypothetical protein
VIHPRHPDHGREQGSGELAFFADDNVWLPRQDPLSIIEHRRGVLFDEALGHDPPRLILGQADEIRMTDQCSMHRVAVVDPRREMLEPRSFHDRAERLGRRDPDHMSSIDKSTPQRYQRREVTVRRDRREQHAHDRQL